MSSLTVSTTLGGSGVNDTLIGGGSGVDLGFILEGKYVPIILQSANSGYKSLYIRHDGTLPITSVKTFIAEYSQPYGGQATASLDFASLKAKGLASGNSSNNSDGLSSGLRIEQDADILGALGFSAFEGSRSQVKIYGRDYGSGPQGIDLDTAFPLHVDCMLLNQSGTPVDASTPIAGQIGASGDAVLGDTAFIKMRLYLESNPPASGVFQYDWVITYIFLD
jgi:uncharacterized protein GlcG (DUF336 family)